jgi:hypothetical protein
LREEQDIGGGQGSSGIRRLPFCPAVDPDFAQDISPAKMDSTYDQRSKKRNNSEHLGVLG